MQYACPCRRTPLLRKWRCVEGPDFGGPGPVLPEELQHCNSFDFAGLLNRGPATRSATAAATFEVSQRREGEKEQRLVWTRRSRRCPAHGAWSARRTPNPVRSYAPAVSEPSAAANHARPCVSPVIGAEGSTMRNARRGALPGATGLSERRSGAGFGGTSPAPLPPQGLARHAQPGPNLYTP
jgi:hypothetical protein